MIVICVQQGSAVQRRASCVVHHTTTSGSGSGSVSRADTLWILLELRWI